MRTIQDAGELLLTEQALMTPWSGIRLFLANKDLPEYRFALSIQGEITSCYLLVRNEEEGLKVYFVGAPVTPRNGCSPRGPMPSMTDLVPQLMRESPSNCHRTEIREEDSSLWIGVLDGKLHVKMDTGREFVEYVCESELFS